MPRPVTLFTGQWAVLRRRAAGAGVLDAVERSAAARSVWTEI
jgi:hypothetical protein